MLLNPCVVSSEKCCIVAARVTRADADLARYGTVDTQAKQDWRWMLAEREDVPQMTWAHLTTAEKESANDWHPPYYRIRGVWAAPRLQADAWIAPPGRPTSDTVRPMPGKVNLICTVGEATDQPGHAYSASVLTAFIRHWLTKYGAQNLEVTMVWPDTTRVLLYHPPWGNATLQFASPAAAAGWYLQDYEHLPVAVAVQAPHPQTVMAPNGQPMTVNRLQFNAFWAHDPELVRSTWLAEHLHNGMFAGKLLRPAEEPGTCAIIGRDGTMEHTSIQDDYLVNTRWAMRLLFEGPGAPPRPQIMGTRTDHGNGSIPQRP